MDKQVVKEFASVADLERLNNLGYSFLIEDGIIKKIYDRAGKEI